MLEPLGECEMMGLFSATAGELLVSGGAISTESAEVFTRSLLANLERLAWVLFLYGNC